MKEKMEKAMRDYEAGCTGGKEGGDMEEEEDEDEYYDEDDEDIEYRDHRQEPLKLGEMIRGEVNDYLKSEDLDPFHKTTLESLR